MGRICARRRELVRKGRCRASVVLCSCSHRRTAPSVGPGRGSRAEIRLGPDGCIVSHLRGPEVPTRFDRTSTYRTRVALVSVCRCVMIVREVCNAKTLGTFGTSQVDMAIRVGT